MIIFLLLLIGTVGFTLLFSMISTLPYLMVLWVVISLIISIVLIFGFVYGVLVPLFNKLSINNPLKYKVARQICSFLIVVCRTRYKVVDKEKLVSKNEKQVVFVANHKSNLDGVWLFLMLNRPISVLAKSTLEKNKFYLPLMRAFNIVSVDRDNDRVAARQMVEGIKLVKNGLNMLVFPEGGVKTREVEQMVSLRAGAYKLATKSNSIIQPIAIVGSSKLKGRRWYKFNTITLQVLDPIYPSEYEGLNTHQIGMKVVDSVNEVFKHEPKFKFQTEE